ncbi:MAG: butyrate kinase [Candidatus Latescibacteria bacterium]|nr:butyrate kinase [bacterium]MBD3425558.1 butyrate kinase [Candidatus Latescibacterota bacterium]
MFEKNLELLEAKLNGLLSVVKEEGKDQEVEKELRNAVENAHYGRFEDEVEYLDFLQRIVRILKPPVMNRDWQQAWGNIFTQLINDLKSLSAGSGRIISGLYGSGDLPKEASGEKVLCLNPGSTSTKVALYQGFDLIAEEEVHLPPDYDDSVEARTAEITRWLSSEGIKGSDLSGIACRGGFVGAVPTGTYRVCDEMITDVQDPIIDHASNMGVQIGMILHREFQCGENTLITMTDPVASDEMETTARLTGIRKILRDGRGVHYLNQRAIHRLASYILGVEEHQFTTVGAHIGGGISVVRHEEGKIVDVVNAFSGIPSANRCGNIPLGVLLRAIDNKDMSIPELRKYLFGQGGMLDLTGTNDFRALLHFRDSGAMGNQKKKIDIVIDFMARNIAGEIMKLSAVEKDIDLVLLTGGLSKSSEFTSMIREKLYPHFTIGVIPGSIEYESLVAGHMRARFNPSRLKDYHREKDTLRKRREEEEKLFATEIFSDPQLRKKETEPVTSLDEVAYMARSLVAARKPPVIAIVGAENEDAVVAAKQANEEGRYPVAKFLLVGDYYEVNKIAWDYDITVDGDNYTIVDSHDPVEKSIELLDSGKADLLMKGGVKTADIMKATLTYLKESGRMKKGSIYSHVGVFQIPTYPRLLFVSDAALIPNPSPKIKRKIIENAVMVAKHLNINKPRVALISAVETMIPSVESSMQAGEMAVEYVDREDCIVEGPLSLDIAMDPRSAKEKHYRGQIKGNADILIMPDIEAGNVVYKSLTVSSGAYLAGVIIGGGVPIVLTSRGDSARSKLSSICLASIIALRQGDIAGGSG